MTHSAHRTHGGTGEVSQYGRRAVEQLVLTLMERTDSTGRGTRRRPLPVLSLIGPPGSGKTFLLDTLGGGFEGRVPFARLDFRALPDITVREILWYLTFELNRWCADYGRLAFGRYLVGELAMSLDLDGLHRAQARAKVKEALEQHRHVELFRSFVRGLSERATALAVQLSNPDPATAAAVRDAASYAPNLLVGGLLRWRPIQRVVLGDAAGWYAHPPGSRPADPTDTLVDLNRMSQAPDPQEQAAAEDLLLAAFLADLDEQFGPHHPVHRRPRYCAVLLDNADTDAGTDFVARLCRSRQDAALADPGRGPVVVVATSRTPPDGAVVRDCEQASYEDWRRTSLTPEQSAHVESGWRYDVALRALSITETFDLVASLRVPDARRVAAFLHRLTAGHPDATVVLAHALRRRPVEPGVRATAVGRAVLDLPAPDPSEGFLSEYLLGRLFRDVDKEVVGLLVTCAAARNLTDARRMLAAEPGWRFPAGFAAAGGWAVRAGPGARRGPGELPGPGGGPVPGLPDHRGDLLHPLPRRLLLAELAARPRSAPDSWDATHRRLRDQCADLGDDDGVQHHNLALERVNDVVRALRSRLAEPVEGWQASLEQVTSAPNRLPRSEAPLASLARLLRVVDSSDPIDTTLAQLTVGRWILADPLGDPAGELHGTLADAYRRLASLVPGGFEQFTQEADLHDRRGAHGG